MTPISTNQHHERVKLPLDCEADYFPKFLTPAESEEIFDFLCRNYDLSPDTIRMADGSLFQNDRGKYLFADPELTDVEHLPEVLGKRAEWPPLLEMVKTRLETVVGREFNVCLCIHYGSGSVEAGFHTDMAEFGSVSFITVVSLGAKREFVFRSKQDTSQEYRMVLRQGSLLTMGENCQERYEHAVPADPDCRNPRISLSYRPFGLDRVPPHP